MAGPEESTIGGYYLRRRLGGSGTNALYLVQRPSPEEDTERAVVVKVSHADPANPAAPVEPGASLESLRAIARLAHPHILPLLDFGVEHDRYYLVQPYLPAGSLADLLARQIEPRLALPAAPTLAASLMREAAEALQYAHDHGILHRNLKPENLLIEEASAIPSPPVPASPLAPASSAPHAPSGLRVLVTDFALPSATSEAVSGISGRLPLFLSPEQCRGTALPASDQYALAGIAYLLLTGQTVFSGTVAELYFHHLATQPSPATQRNPALPPATDTVLLRALAKDPAQRYPSVLAWAEALEAAVNPSAQTSLSPWPRTPAPLPHRASLPTIVPSQAPHPLAADGPAAPLPGMWRKLRRHQPPLPGEPAPAAMLAPPPGTPIASERDAPAARLPLGRGHKSGRPVNMTVVLLAAVLLAVLVVAATAAVADQGSLPFLGQIAREHAPHATATATRTPTPTPFPTANPHPSFKRFTSSAIDLTLLVPDGWSYNPSSDVISLDDSFYAPQPNTYAILMMAFTAGSFRGASNDWIVDNATMFLLGSSVRLMSRGQITVGGHTCSYGFFTFQGGYPRGQLEALLAGCNVNEETYVLDFASPRASFAMFDSSYFGPMLRSVRFGS